MKNGAWLLSSDRNELFVFITYFIPNNPELLSNYIANILGTHSADLHMKMFSFHFFLLLRLLLIFVEMEMMKIYQPTIVNKKKRS